MAHKKNDLLGEILTVKSISKPASAPNQSVKRTNSKPLLQKGLPSSTTRRKAAERVAGEAAQLARNKLNAKLWNYSNMGPRPPRHNPRASLVPAKKSSILAFVENLKRIEQKTEQLDVVGEANEEIDIAFRQLDELKKLLTRKIREQTINELRSNYHGEEGGEHTPKKAATEEKMESSCSRISKLNRNLERLRKKYEQRPKVQYKSLKDFDEVFYEKQQLKKPPTESKKLETITTSTETSPRAVSMPKPIVKSVSIKEPPQEVLYKNTSTFSVDSESDYADSLPDEEPGGVREAESCTRVDTPRVDKFGELIAYAFENDKEKVSLYKSVFRNPKSKLEESIMKSDFLLKEFSVTEPSGEVVAKKGAVSRRRDAGGDKKFEEPTTGRQTCKLEANLSERDRKLYTTLNLSLKNSLYTTIGKIN